MVRLLKVRWMVWRTWTEGFSYWVMAMASGEARVRWSVISIANFFFSSCNLSFLFSPFQLLSLAETTTEMPGILSAGKQA